MELRYERALRSWVQDRGMRWKRFTREAPDRGRTVSYRLTPSQEPRAEVMLVHGAGNDALFAFTELVMALLSSGFEVFTFDLDGHGRGSTTQLDPRTLHEAVPRAVHDSGAAKSGLPLHLIGVSFGGALALDALRRHPQLFASGVIVAAPLEVTASRTAILGELRMPLLKALWRARTHAGVWGSIPSFGPVKRGLYPLRLAVPPAEGAFGYVEVLNAAIRRLGLPAAAADIEVPVLLVYAGRDRIVPIEQGEALHRLIPGSELIRLPAETHLSVLSAALPQVVDWLAALTAKAAR